jgi:NADH-quinone oxidoreductase subunit M
MDHAAHPSPIRSDTPATFQPGHLIALLLIALATAVAASFAPSAVWVVLAAVVAALAPRHQSWGVRTTLGVTAALMALFVVSLVPEWAAANEIAAPASEEGHRLSWLIAVPVAGAVVVLFLPRRATRTIQWAALVTMAITLAVALPLLGVTMGRGYHFNEVAEWIPRFGIRYHVAIDGISLWLVMLTVFITPIAAYASFGSIHARMKDWCFALLLLEAAMLGALVALDLFLFYTFWELMLVPMVVMIGVWGGTNRLRSAIKFFLYTMFGSVLMLGALIYVAYQYARVAGHPSFDYFDLQTLMLPRHLQIWLWAAFTLAFVIKVPMFPVHTWLPDAHTEAPTAGSVILAAVMLKMGTYGYLRYAIGLFPEASAEFAANLAGVAVLGGIIYGALCAWKQTDVKRLIAYSSVAHLGYVMLGLFALSQASIEGSVLQMVNHGISTGMLFLLFGVIYDRRHTRHIDDFGGLAAVMPVYAMFFLIATLASIGLPGTNGFVGEFMIITGTAASRWLGRFAGEQAVGAAIGVILGAIYMLMVVQKMFFGPVTKDENRHLPDVNPRELVSLAPLAMLIFVIGLFPNIFLSQIKQAAARVQDDFSARVTVHPGPQFYQGPIKLAPPRPEAPRPTDTAPVGGVAKAEAGH